MNETVKLANSNKNDISNSAVNLEFVRVRFAGDSGDGMQLTGTQFANSTALAGSDLTTFPDYPSEIRAPVGTTFGVSAFSICFGARGIFSHGDQPDMLIAMNPAALKTNISDLRLGGTVIVDTDAFTKKNLVKAGYESDPLVDETNDSLAMFTKMLLPISSQTMASVQHLGMSKKDALRCKNIWALGLMLWVFGRDRASIVDWINEKFVTKPLLAEGNIAALNAGHAYGETTEIQDSIQRYHVGQAPLEPGEYRTITGSDAVSFGLVTGARLAGLDLFLGSYPITPATTILHTLAKLKDNRILTFQAEDEIAGICSAIGASFGGALGVTTSSGPGMALKTEALGLAVSTELPLVIVNVQRGGPSTGLPTKTEQSDLFQAIFGRNGDTPIPVIAAKSPDDCFDCAIESVRIATKYMTPVILLMDGYIANTAAPWRIPAPEKMEPFPVKFHSDPEGFHPFLRDEKTGARPWAVPGTSGLEHRIGGLEKDYNSGNISYDGVNHQKMTNARQRKISNIADDIPKQDVCYGRKTGRLAVVTWGSTYGPAHLAVERSRLAGLEVSHIHLRHMWPFPENLTELLSEFDDILIPEMNTGQLRFILESQLHRSLNAFNKVTGQPMRITEIMTAINQVLEA